MSRADLSPTALAELEIGSGQDHNARHERHTRMLSAAYEPLVSNAAFLFFLTLGLAIFAGLVMYWAMGGKL